ncbi:cation:proton antiporter [Ktedonobacter racemifer]|uniref:Sodium/hydrogen exchanger n=1 Tax=Ktedonobacter racemifer DSM 44963 TaxID=485913 RepID=D6U513_KTERA|nr:cation:proton antiporter [Ktedonobacter racemifer]EFH81593.1 sodium/hydrogen exchanger [Ktedonobacter racemifer DSM 44963]
MVLSALAALSNSDLTTFFLAISLLLLFAHLFGYVFQRLHMPKVIGEIAGGLLLGPTLFGWLAPHLSTIIFGSFAAEDQIFSSFSWLGLVMLMFISGFELQKSFRKDDRKLILALLLGGTVVSFAAGWIAPDFYPVTALIGTDRNFLALRIIIGCAVAVTSIPVISKIFLDLHIAQTRFAKIIIAVATIEDVVLWVAIAIATALVSTQPSSPLAIPVTLLFIAAFFLIALLLLPPLLRLLQRLHLPGLAHTSSAGYALLLCLSLAALANLLNINVVFGALLAGIVLEMVSNGRFEKVKASIKDVALGVFVPLYFALVGFKLDLVHHFDVGFFLLFLLFATFFKMLGTILAARLVGENWLSSLNVGAAMNTRGGPGIVLATVAYGLGIISESFFATLVMVAIITSLMAGYWFRLILNKQWELLPDLPEADDREEMLPVAGPAIQEQVE